MSQGEGGGRPPFYETDEELQAKIQEYFDSGMDWRDVVTGPPNNRRVEKVKVPTITGLVLYLGFADRASFYDMEKQEKFSHTIKRARTMIEKEYEMYLQTGGGAGAIFALKNFGWVDQRDIVSAGRALAPVPIYDMTEGDEDGDGNDDGSGGDSEPLPDQP